VSKVYTTLKNVHKSKPTPFYRSRNTWDIQVTSKAFHIDTINFKNFIQCSINRIDCSLVNGTASVMIHNERQTVYT